MCRALGADLSMSQFWFVYSGRLWNCQEPNYQGFEPTFNFLTFNVSSVERIVPSSSCVEFLGMSSQTVSVSSNDWERHRICSLKSWIVVRVWLMSNGVCLTLRDRSFLERGCRGTLNVADCVCWAEVLSCDIKEGSKTFSTGHCSIDVLSNEILWKRPSMSHRSLFWLISLYLANSDLVIVIVSMHVFRI